MKQLFNPLLFVLMLAAFGCSAPQQQTESTFKVGTRSLTASSASLFPGGLILYGVSGSQSFSRVMTTDSQNEVIPNGVWDFHVIGWDGNSNVGESLSGKVYCASQTGVELNGEPVTINLTASNSNCTKAAFGPNVANVDRGDGSGTSNWFPLIDVETCNKLGAADCRYNPAVDGTYSNNRGVALSYRVIAHSYDRLSAKVVIPPGTGKLASGCAKVDTSNADGTLTATETFADTYLNIPYSSNMIFTLRAYLGSDSCDDSFGFRDIHIGSNLNPEPRVSVAYDGTDTNVVSAVTTMKDICSNPADLSGSTVAPFSGGDGNIGSPYIICKNWQLNEIAHLYLDKHFIVGKPLDMNELTKGLGHENEPVCGMPGMTMIPIGGLLDDDQTSLDCTTGVGGEYETKYETTPATPVAFTGVFDGNLQLIKGIRIKMSNRPQVGFVRQLGDATGTPVIRGKLINLRLKDFEVEGKEKVGLVGLQSQAAGLGGVIYDVEIDGGEATGEGGGTAVDVGAVVGRQNTGTLERAIVRNFKVKGKNSMHIGGIAGIIMDSASKISFEGRIFAEPNTNHIGGAVGLLADGATLDEAATRGQINSQGTPTGGVIGKINNTGSGAVAKNVYSHMYVRSDFTTATTGYVGGLVGNNSTGTLNFGVFAGEVYQTPLCSAGCTVSSDNITNGTTATNVFYHSDADFTTPPANELGENLLNPSVMNPNLNPSASNPGIWSLMQGRYPKLAFEPSSLCDEPANLALPSAQSSNPVVICNFTQFEDFLGNPQAKSYILGESIPVGNIAGGVTLPSGAMLDGKGRSLLNLYLSTANDSIYYGLFAAIQSNATIKNLHVSGAFNPDNDNIVSNASGLLAGINQGNIIQTIVGGESSPNDPDTYSHVANTGLVVGENQGQMRHVKALGYMKGNQYLGGIAAYNKGVIELSKSQAFIQGAVANSNDPGRIGGVAGQNLNGGQIAKSASYAIIYLPNGTGTEGYLGLIAGINQAQSEVVYSYVGQGGSLSVPNATGATAIGSFVGENSNSSISYSFSRGQLDIASYNSSVMEPFVGVNSGNVNYTYFEQSVSDSSGTMGTFINSTAKLAVGFTDMNSFTNWGITNYSEDDIPLILQWYVNGYNGAPTAAPFIWEMSGNGPSLFEIKD